MPAPIPWLDQAIVHTTRHRWEVVAAQPWTASSIPLARRDGEVLGLNRDLPVRYQPSTDTLEGTSRHALEGQNFGPPQFRCIWLGRRPIGYLFYGQRGADFGLPTIAIREGPGQRHGLGSAVVMALLYGVHLAGGTFEILQVDNPCAFQRMLMAEGFGTAQVHLVRNELLIDAKTRARGIAAYPRKQVALCDFKIEETNEIPRRARRYLSDNPMERHAWWIERIVICPSVSPRER